jgi:hypothetical protein
MSDWQVDDTGEDGGSSYENSEHSEHSGDFDYDFNGDGDSYAQTKSGLTNGSGEQHKRSRQDLFADRAAKAAIMGIESGSSFNTHFTMQGLQHYCNGNDG